MSKKRIAILTGGGDVPGLNSVIKEVTYRATENDREVIGIRRGWEGLTHVNLDDPESKKRYVLPLDRGNTRTVDRTGGTFLHSSRTNPAKMKAAPDFLKGMELPKALTTKKGVTSETIDMSPQVIRNIERLGIDFLIAIGGDVTLSYAAHLDKLGVPVAAVPKTMDNDVRNTEYCIGFSTAITRATDAINRQRTTVGSHERIGLFRLFGRDAGYTALYTAYVTNIRCVIPEFKVDLEKMIELLLCDKRNNPSNYCLLVLSEGAQWAGYVQREYGEPDGYGHRKKYNIAEALAEEIHARAKEETVVSDLTYDLRSGAPDFVDKLVASTFGTMALDCVLENRHGLMAAIVDGKYDMVPIPDPKLGPRQVNIENMYNKDRYRPSYTNKTGLPIFLTRA